MAGVSRASETPAKIVMHKALLLTTTATLNALAVLSLIRPGSGMGSCDHQVIEPNGGVPTAFVFSQHLNDRPSHHHLASAAHLDSYCDDYSGYNGLDCAWDGGDCCASTCEDGTSECGVHAAYHCLDAVASDYEGECQQTCSGETCNFWTLSGYACETLEDDYGCNCAHCASCACEVRTRCSSQPYLNYFALTR